MYLYVIQCDEALKVGIATNLLFRLSSLQSGNPVKLKLVKAWSGPPDLVKHREWQIHEALKDVRIRGEWFLCSLVDIEAVLRAFHDDASEQWLEVVGPMLSTGRAQPANTIRTSSAQGDAPKAAPALKLVKK